MTKSFHKRNQEWRRGGRKHLIPHREWLHPDDSIILNTRKKNCYKCFRPKNHPIHKKKYRNIGKSTGNWEAWITEAKRTGFKVFGPKLEEVLKKNGKTELEEVPTL